MSLGSVLLTSVAIAGFAWVLAFDAQPLPPETVSTAIHHSIHVTRLS